MERRFDHFNQCKVFSENMSTLLISRIMSFMDRSEILKILMPERTKQVALAWSILRQSHLSEDAYQDMLARVFENDGIFEGPQHLRDWSWKVLRNRCYELIRQQKYQVKLLDESILDLVDAELEDYAYDDAKPGDQVSPRFITWDGEEGKLLTGMRPQQLRNHFADWMTSAENPRFAAEIANRLWKKLFGVAVKEPVTDLDVLEDATNPELLRYLAQLMKDVDFDLREFQRIVLNSRAYQRQVSVMPPEGEDFRFPGPLLGRMTAEQTWDSIVLLLRGPEIDQLKIDNAPSIERLVFPFEFTHDRKGIAKDREKIFEFAKTLLPNGKVSNGDGGRGLFLGTSGRRTKLRGEESWLRASELPQPMPPTHFLRVAGQSAREVADDGSTEGGITESLAMMNGEVTKSLMTNSLVMNTSRKKKTQVEQIAFLYRTCLSRLPREQDTNQCLAALDQGLDLGDIAWALLNSREFMFIQ